MSVKAHEAYCLDSQQDHLLWWDDFLGDQLQDEWATAGTGSAAVIDAQTGGIVRITTGAVNGNLYTVNWNDTRSLLVTKKATMEIRMKASAATFIQIAPQLRLGANDLILFTVDEQVGGAINWNIKCTDGGASTTLDSGVVLDTDYHIFRIECHTHGSNHVHFYIDGVETANSPITTNIPDDAADYLQPHFFIRTREGATKSIDIDYCVVRQEI